MYQLADIRPIQLDDLVRIGNQGDGGYVISHCQLNKTKVLLSFGISDDWSFDIDFLQKTKDAALYAYDYSVSARIIRKRILKYLSSSIYRFATLDFKGGTEYASLAFKKSGHSFNQFFNPSKNRYFFKKYLGIYDNEEYVSISHIFSDHVKHPVEELSVFVKMDIEESEYRTLQSFKPFYHLINGFAIEFHNLDILGNNFTEIVKDLSTDFYVAHVHANNIGGVIYQTQLPITLEVTFINKRMLPSVPVPSTYTYPIPEFDFACNKKIPDIRIKF